MNECGLLLRTGPDVNILELDISVYSLFEGEPISHLVVRNLIDFLLTMKRYACYRKEFGIKYNDDYLNYRF